MDRVSVPAAFNLPLDSELFPDAIKLDRHMIQGSRQRPSNFKHIFIHGGLFADCCRERIERGRIDYYRGDLGGWHSLRRINLPAFQYS